MQKQHAVFLYENRSGDTFMKTNKTYYIALLGIMLATTLVAMTLDRTLSVVLPIGIAWFCLTVSLCFAFMKRIWWVAVLAGLFFGLSSLITAPIGGKEVFLNPLISVLPRLIAMTMAYLAYILVLFLTRKLENQKKAQYIALTIGTFIGVCTNTATVFTALVWWGGSNSIVELFKALVWTNIVPELVIATSSVPPIVLRVRKAMQFGIDGRLDKFTDAP